MGRPGGLGNEGEIRRRLMLWLAVNAAYRLAPPLAAAYALYRLGKRRGRG